MSFNRTAWGMESDRDDWREQAACRPGTGVNPEWFFNDGFGEVSTRFNELAKGICLRCPVVEFCLAESLERHDQFGVFGGMTAAERRGHHRVRKPRIRATHCKRGHEFTAESTYVQPGGVRHCRICESLRQRTARTVTS